MMSHGNNNNNNFLSDINVTPFVDVMLVLLIIFMVTAPMMSQGVNVALPEAVSKPFTSDKDQLVISINDKSQIYINKYQVSVDILQEKLKNILKNHINRDVYLRADKNIPYGTVVRVMSEIKEAGVNKLGMVTENTKQ